MSDKIIGEVLKANLYRLKTASTNRNDENAFWKILRDIGKEEIISLYPQKVDSDIIIEIYYSILKNNLDSVPKFYRECLKCNGQERFRVINRNVFSSNAFHIDGLARQKGIKAYKKMNINKKGKKVVYMGDETYVDSRR